MLFFTFPIGNWYYVTDPSEPYEATFTFPIGNWQKQISAANGIESLRIFFNICLHLKNDATYLQMYLAEYNVTLG